MKRGKQKNVFQRRATIGAFIVLIFVPSILWMVFGGAIGDDLSENRRLAEMPEFDFAKIEEYPKRFDTYYNDHVPFRAFFRNIWTRANYIAFADSTSSRVIVGDRDDNNIRKAWLFYDEGEGFSPVEGVQGLLSHTDQEKERAVNMLKANAEQMAKEGRQLYFFVAPNKENVYREYLPNTIEIFDEKSHSEKMIDLLSGVFENVVYAKDEIMDAKQYGKLYSRQDTHWNELGGFYGFKALMNVIQPDYNNFEYNVETPKLHSREEDLARFLGMTDFFLDDDPEVEYLEDKPVTTEVLEDSLRELEISYNEDPVIDKTIMIVGDSYRTSMKPYFQKVFRRVITMVREDSARSLIDEYNPDIVILEAVERCTFVSAAFSLL